MKFMGSKHKLLSGPLGTITLREARNAERFIDLFSGSGVVVDHVARLLPIRTLAVDLQRFSAILAADKIERTIPVCADLIERKWLDPATTAITNDSRLHQALRVSIDPTGASVLASRKLCEQLSGGFFWRHYGGHYFSPHQALMLDALYDCLPSDRSQRILALAAMIRTSSRCAAAPGHTAQPFQPTDRLLPFIAEAWKRNPLEECRRWAMQAGATHALRPGLAIIADARHLARAARPGDVVFLDPPYSAAQYSRFYHVLEAIAIGGYQEVSGAGRSPIRSCRQTSVFSCRSIAMHEFARLLRTLRDAGATVILTFPDTNASNGLSARKIISASGSYFSIETTASAAVHSTLGGSPIRRPSRRSVDEIIMVLRPR
jgi:adenine-specific DNA-methyltransferase